MPGWAIALTTGAGLSLVTIVGNWSAYFDGNGVSPRDLGGLAVSFAIYPILAMLVYGFYQGYTRGRRGPDA